MLTASGLGILVDEILRVRPYKAGLKAGSLIILQADMFVDYDILISGCIEQEMQRDGRKYCQFLMG